MNKVRYRKPQDITIGIADIGINNDYRQPIRPADHFHPLTSQSIATKGNNRPTLSTPDFDPHMSSFPPYVRMHMPLPLLPYPSPHPLPVGPRMLVTGSEMYRPSESMEQGPPHFIASPYLPLPSTPPPYWPPDSSYMSQRPIDLK